jgi:hypothetical protein
VIRSFGGAKPTSEVTAGHTFYMEELGVKAGDSVSHSPARRTTTRSTARSRRAATSISFASVHSTRTSSRRRRCRRGRRRWRRSKSRAVGAAVRSFPARSTFERGRRASIAAAERVGGRILEVGVGTGISLPDYGMNSRLVVSDPSFKKIAELLPKAAEQMTAAEKKLQAQSADGALPPENLALQFLQQAEEEFELQVQTGRQAGGGGGGGGAGSIANDLADLFKMEMDKMANQ